MAKKKSSGNNTKKVKLVKRKTANIFKAKSSGRSKYIGKKVNTALHKNVTLTKNIENSNESFETVRELLHSCSKKQQKKKMKLKQLQPINVVSTAEVNETASLMQNL